MDSLYAFVAKSPASAWNADRITGLRWHDPDPDPAHGRVQWFGFPLYYFVQEQAQETFNRSIDWFREDSAGP